MRKWNASSFVHWQTSKTLTSLSTLTLLSFPSGDLNPSKTKHKKDMFIRICVCVCFMYVCVYT